jgi:ATP-binding cassette subfamily A (ABC1) protein 3
MREEIIVRLMNDMGIVEYENIYSQNLSGGNKRKLSVSMAIMGNPPIIFLDEPSTGVDPQAKRFMWNIISKISRERK